MKELLSFNFENVDGLGTNVEILVLAKVPSDIERKERLYKKIDKAVISFTESVDDWQYEELVTSVLNSLMLEFDFVQPHTFNI